MFMTLFFLITNRIIGRWYLGIKLLLFFAISINYSELFNLCKSNTSIFKKILLNSTLRNLFPSSNQILINAHTSVLPLFINRKLNYLISCKIQSSAKILKKEKISFLNMLQAVMKNQIIPKIKLMSRNHTNLVRRR